MHGMACREKAYAAGCSSHSERHSGQDNGRNGRKGRVRRTAPRKGGLFGACVADGRMADFCAAVGTSWPAILRIKLFSGALLLFQLAQRQSGGLMFGPSNA